MTHFSASFRRQLLLGLVLVALSSVACVSSAAPLSRVGSPPYERGSGAAATETRPIGAFHAIEAAQGTQIVVESGSTNAATVTADDNLLTHVETTVDGGTLRIRVVGNIETRLPLTVRVVATDALDSITATSAATLDVRHVEATKLTVRAITAGRVTVAGNADRLDLYLDAASVAELGELAVVDASVAIGAASSATARVENSVTGTCLAASTLQLVGRPRSQSVTTDLTSSVRVR